MQNYFLGGERGTVKDYYNLYFNDTILDRVWTLGASVIM